MKMERLLVGTDLDICLFRCYNVYGRVFSYLTSFLLFVFDGSERREVPMGEIQTIGAKYERWWKREHIASLQKDCAMLGRV